MATGYLPPVSRRIVTALVVLGVLGLFTWEWTAAPRVRAAPHVERQLANARGELYLGTTFEGLPLRTVKPFLYSDCVPGKAHVVPCAWIKVDRGFVSGDDPQQVARARARLRPVS
jgi:hypothetical protein